MKKKIFMVGVLAVALTFGAVQNVSAQARAFSSTQNRDATLLGAFETMPYYIIGIGGRVAQQVGRQMYQFNEAIDDIHYSFLQGGLWIFFNTEDGDRVVMLFLSSTKEEAEKNIATGEADPDMSRVFGVFEAGTTDASRRAALQRILTAINAYYKNGNVVPQQW